jgi:hypothetical protein
MRARTDLALWTGEEMAPRARAILPRDRDDPSRFVSLRAVGKRPGDRDWRASDGSSSRVGRIRRLRERFEAHTFDPAAQVRDSLP